MRSGYLFTLQAYYFAVAWNRPFVWAKLGHVWLPQHSATATPLCLVGSPVPVELSGKQPPFPLAVRSETPGPMIDCDPASRIRTSTPKGLLINFSCMIAILTWLWPGRSDPSETLGNMITRAT